MIKIILLNIVVAAAAVFAQGNIEGYITSQADSAALDNVKVTLKTEEGDTLGSTLTDTTGYYVFNEIPLTSVREINSSIPSEYKVYQNFPNPFNPHTHIRFDTKKAGKATLKIYDIKGSEVKTAEASVSAGTSEFDVYLHDKASGVYIYQISVDDQNIGTGKMIMTKGYGHETNKLKQRQH